MLYTDQSRIENFLQRELTDDEAAGINDLIEAISIQINDYTDQQWLSIDGSDEDEESTRFFDGTGSKELFIDDFVGLQEVVILDNDGNEVTTYDDEDNWQVMPFNSNPKSSIRLRDSHFPHGVGNIKITATFGGGALPKDVILVATELAAKYIDHTASSGSLKRESIEGYSRELVNDSDFALNTVSVLSRLDGYKKILL